jgi:UDP-glucose 4-epimerase
MGVYNIGAGQGSTVLDVIAAFSRASGRPIPYDILPRRPSDVPERVTDPSAVNLAWGWRPTRGLTDVCRDAWHFQRLNPYGYADHPRQPNRHE